MRWKAVIFDMDGTTLNTLDDLLGAINYAMEQGGHRHDFPKEEGRYFAGSGVANSMRRALAREAGVPAEELVAIGGAAAAVPQASSPGTAHITARDAAETGSPEAASPAENSAAGKAGETSSPDPAAVLTPQMETEAVRLLAIFRPYYDAHCNDSTGPYPGIPELMKTLRAAGVKTAIVSNKPDGAACALAGEHFPGLVDFCIGEREGVPRKPARDMVDLALRELGITNPRDAVYMGDSEVDLQTAANAGLDCIAAEWGFRGRTFLAGCGADTIISRPEDAAALILGE